MSLTLVGGCSTSSRTRFLESRAASVQTAWRGEVDAPRAARLREDLAYTSAAEGR